MAAFTFPTSEAINELDSHVIESDWADEDGDPLGPVSLETLTLTLYDLNTHDPTIHASGLINGIDGEDILNVGRGVIDAAGHLVTRIYSADNLIVTAGNRREKHKALIVATWNSGLGRKSQEFIWTVTNITKVPT